jgi:hypothetical protein
MTADGVAGERAPAPTGGWPASLPVPMILGLCDRVLGEIGRRGHLFAWLRPPGPGTDDWLVVDSYYPSNRLVVVCREQPAAHDHLYAELVPSHGLQLLALTPKELGGGPADAELALKALIAELALPSRRPAAPEPQKEVRIGESAIARVTGSFARLAAPARIEPPRAPRSRAAAAERGARFVAARSALPRREPAIVRRPLGRQPPAARTSPPRPVSRSTPRAIVIPRTRTRILRSAAPVPNIAPVGLLVGVALAAVLCAEMYFGIGKVMLDGGRWLLGFGILLDACSRTLGTVAAGRVRRPDWAWGCVIGGSPVVAAFALFRSEGAVSTEPAPLAGLISVLAALVIAIALLAAAVGI